MRRTSLFTLVSALLVVVGCNDNTPGPGMDAGTADTGATDDAYVPPGNDANVDAYRMPLPPHDGGYDDGGMPPAFTGANETWVGVEIEGARCGNGSPLVVGVNMTTASSDVVIYFQGGGACWDPTTCFTLGTATHTMDTLTPADVVDEARTGASFFFERNAQNPYQHANYVYIPYCTGDAHAGNNVATFRVGSGTQQMHFEGAHNTEIVFRYAHATWPTPGRVTLVGASAGGYGVIANWFRAQDEFAGVRVDALSDCGLPIDAPLTRWHTFQTVWGFTFPTSCTTCDSVGDALPYYATTMTPPHRFGLLAFLDDTVIPNFYGATQSNIHTALLDLRDTTSLTPNQRTFYVDQMGHVLMTSPNLSAGGVSVRQWVTQFATDDPAWADVGP
jgi:hypothetical protein